MKLLIKILAIVFLPFMIGIMVHPDNERGKNANDFSPLYPEHIAGAYTGGFGEQSCHSCHFDYDLNQPEGEVSILGMDDFFDTGREYTINLYVKRKDMNRAGFQMTARFKDGSQAGEFEISDEFTTTPNIENDVTYLQHGVGQVEVENGEKNWQILWTAPDYADQSIIFNIAVNAANGDASEFGDWIYLKEIEVERMPK